MKTLFKSWYPTPGWCCRATSNFARPVILDPSPLLLSGTEREHSPINKILSSAFLMLNFLRKKIILLSTSSLFIHNSFPWHWTLCSLIDDMMTTWQYILCFFLQVIEPLGQLQLSWFSFSSDVCWSRRIRRRRTLKEEKNFYVLAKQVLTHLPSQDKQRQL